MSPSDQLSLVRDVARLLNAGPAAEALAGVAGLLRERLPASAVAIRQAAPDGDPAGDVVSSGHLPFEPAAADARFDLVHGGRRVGRLEVRMNPDARARSAAVLGVLAEVIAPHLAARRAAGPGDGWERGFRDAEQQRRLIGLVADSLPLGLYVVDREYRIQVWNRKRETGTQGIPRENVVGRPVFEVLTRQDPERMRAEFDRVFASGEILQMELESPAAEGRRFYRISKIPMRLEGAEVTHVVTVGQDVTEWRLAQERVVQGEKLAAVGQLAAGVMHEINNPLATIGACAAAIAGRLEETAAGPARDAVEKYVRIIEGEVERCTRIIDGLLDFSRPKGQRRRPLEIGELVRETLFLLQHHPRFRRRTVGCEVEPGLPPVHGDAEQLQQVFMALLLNAVDAVERGGALGVRAARSAQRPDEVTVEFRDTGVGIPEADLPRIFEPFFTTKPPGRGTGLGLSVCYGIVEEHGGRIEVESRVGEGSAFRVVLPVAEESPTRTRSRSA